MNKSCVNCEFYGREDMTAYDEEWKGLKKITTQRIIVMRRCYSGPNYVLLGSDRVNRACVYYVEKVANASIEYKLNQKLDERDAQMDPIGVCSYKYESAQFCGGPWYQTSCGKITRDCNDLCEFCGKPIVEVGE